MKMMFLSCMPHAAIRMPVYVWMLHPWKRSRVTANDRSGLP